MAFVYNPAPIAKPTRELCIMACCFCRELRFQQWIFQQTDRTVYIDEDGAKAFIVTACVVKSRNELDTNPEAAQRFHEHVRIPFLAWKEAQG